MRTPYSYCVLYTYTYTYTYTQPLVLVLAVSRLSEFVEPMVWCYEADLHCIELGVYL